MPRQPNIERRFPDVAGDIRFNVRQLILKRCIKDPKTGCWNVVKGARHVQGYGMCGAFRLADQKHIMTTTHRAMKKYELQRALARNEEVYHKCSNMACCNPDHLVVGTHSDTMTNMVANDRHPKTRPYAVGNPHMTQRRRYRWTLEDCAYFRLATKQAIQARFPTLENYRISSLRHHKRQAKYAWLDQYIDLVPESDRDK